MIFVGGYKPLDSQTNNDLEIAKAIVTTRNDRQTEKADEVPYRIGFANGAWQ